MEARKVLQLVRKWLWLITLAVLIGGMAGGAVSFLQPKMYESDTTLYVNSPGRSDYQAVTGAEEAAKAFAQIPKSQSVLVAVLRAVGDKSLSLRQLSSMVIVAYTLNTQYITIGVRDSNPERAPRLATEIARQAIAQFETAATGGNQTGQFVQQQMNSLASEIKNLQQQLAQAQRASNSASVDQINTKLSEDRTLYNELLNSYTTMSSVQITVVQPAEIPQNPVGLGMVVAIAMGLLAGLIVIVGVIILIEQIDDIVRTPEKVNQATGLSTLMTMAYLPAVAKQFPQLNVHDEVGGNGHHQLEENVDTVVLEPAMVEQARLLARRSELARDRSQENASVVEARETSWIEGEGRRDVKEETIKRLPAITKQDLAGTASFKVRELAFNGFQLPEEFLTLGVLLSEESGQLPDHGSRVKSLLITSPEDGDGKTLIASQVALGLARVGSRVVLVDANMRKPQVRSLFNLSGRVGLSNRIGLSSILSRNVKVEDSPLFDILQKTDEPNLTILPSGPVIDSPSGLLSSSRMATILNLLSKEAIVVIDSPAVLTSSDAVILAKRCDGVLMVIDARRTAASKLKQALGILTRVNMSILGVILNRADKEK